MENLKTFIHFDKILINLIEESNDFEINIIMYVTRFFNNLKNEVDLYTEEYLINEETSNITNNFMFDLNEYRKEMLNFVDISESECILRCRSNEELFQSKLDSVLQLLIMLRDKFPSEKADIENFVISHEYFKCIFQIKEKSLEFKRKLFIKNYFCVEPVNKSNCDNLNMPKMKNFKLFVIEPFCMDDIQIDLLKFALLIF